MQWNWINMDFNIYFWKIAWTIRYIFAKQFGLVCNQEKYALSKSGIRNPKLSVTKVVLLLVAHLHCLKELVFPPPTEI